MKWEPITKTPVERASANLNPSARTDPDHRVDVTSPAANPMPAAVRETHSSVVLLVGDRAVKLKKPVNLGFLDFSTRRRRAVACRREVELYRRLAPDVYLGVADIRGPDGEPCDHVVVMRRMPEERRLATLVREGAPVDGCVRRLARLIAAFHAAAERGPAISHQGGRDAILDRWTETFDQLRALPNSPLDAAVAADVETRTLEFLAGREPLFTARIAAGRVVDGHGDLLAEDTFCLDDGPRILDCIDSVAVHAALARRHLRAGTVRLILIGGLPGTGKSTLAGRLADRLGAVLLSSDQVRKEITGMAAQTPAPAPYHAGIYRPEWTERTYAELLHWAGTLLALGETVIVDASWGRAAHRKLATELADAGHAEPVLLRCAAATEIAARRLNRRHHGSSDADAAIAAAMAVDADPWPEAATVDTESDVDRCVERAERIVRAASRRTTDERA
jgi:predicted kinase